MIAYNIHNAIVKMIHITILYQMGQAVHDKLIYNSISASFLK